MVHFSSHPFLNFSELVEANKPKISQAQLQLQQENQDLRNLLRQMEADFNSYKKNQREVMEKQNKTIDALQTEIIKLRLALKNRNAREQTTALPSQDPEFLDSVLRVLWQLVS